MGGENSRLHPEFPVSQTESGENFCREKYHHEFPRAVWLSTSSRHLTSRQKTDKKKPRSGFIPPGTGLTVGQVGTICEQVPSIDHF